MSKCYICDKEFPVLLDQNICATCAKDYLPKKVEDMPVKVEVVAPLVNEIVQAIANKAPGDVVQIIQKKPPLTYEEYKAVWLNNGHWEGEYFTMEQFFSLSRCNVFFPGIVREILVEAQNEILQLNKYLTRIGYHSLEATFLPNDNNYYAGDIPEGHCYPERSTGIGCQSIFKVTPTKSGVAVKLYDEVIDQSFYDIVSIHIRAAGVALIRHKEQKLINLMKTWGVAAFDDATPTCSLFGVTGSHAGEDPATGPVRMPSVQDFNDTMSQIMCQGYNPNVIAMHPVAYCKFASVNTALDRFFEVSCGMSLKDGIGVQVRENAPIKLFLTPYIPFDPRKKTTDIFIFDKSHLGYNMFDEDCGAEEFVNPSVDIKHLKIRERYGLAIASEGQAIAVMKDVPTA